VTHKRPLISFVVAMTPAHVIGRDNQLPWHIPADLAHFKRMTVGKPVVMGRRTFESTGRPLPQRDNIVVIRDRSYVAEGCTIVHNVSDALTVAGNVPEIAVTFTATRSFRSWTPTIGSSTNAGNSAWDRRQPILFPSSPSTVGTELERC
jgi:dihydrofolate reductase